MTLLNMPVAPDDIDVDLDNDLINDYTMRWGSDFSDDNINVGASARSFWLEGLGGNDQLVGGSENDVLVGGLGNDILDGREGSENVAIIRGTLTAPNQTYTNNNITYFIFDTEDGVDTLVNIQKVIFDDGELFLDFDTAVTSLSVDSDNDGKIDTVVHTGSLGENTITGDLSLNNQFELGLGNDQATGGAGSDLFIDGLGQDIYDGGNHLYADLHGLGKVDTVWYAGNFDSNPANSDYQIAQEDDGFRITKIGSVDEFDILRNIEKVIFDNATIDIGVQSVSKVAWTNQGIAREYIFTGADYDDEFFSTAGKDTYTSKTGSDIFNISGNSGIDRILDFQVGEDGDILKLDANVFGDFAAVSQKMTATSRGTQIDLGGGNSVNLDLVGVSQLTADNFVFA